MRCEYCEGRTVKKKISKQHWLNGRLYVVENVEAEVCASCGERYFHATTLDQIDSLLRGKHPVERTLEVEVVTMRARKRRGSRSPSALAKR